MDIDITPCARCRRMTQIEALNHWVETQRLRVFSPGDGAFRYVHHVKHHAVCTACLAILARGRHVDDIAQRRAILCLLVIIALGVLTAWLTPMAMPVLLSAFWRTG